MERLNNSNPYWFTGYLISYNLPQRRYGNFGSSANILNDTTLRPKLGDYMFRRSSSGLLYIYYAFTKKGWERLPEIMEYDQNVRYHQLNYLQ